MPAWEAMLHYRGVVSGRHTTWYFVYWKDKIIYTFQNLRRRRDAEHVTVKERRLPKIEGPIVVDDSAKVEYGFKNYSPDSRPASESPETIDLHLKKLKEEVRKKEKNLRTISTIMNLTLYDRRQDVLSNMGVGQLLEKYPCLVDEELLKEFIRLGPIGITDLVDKLLQGINKYGRSIMRAIDRTKGLPYWLRQFKSEIMAEADEVTKRALLGYVAILGLPSLLGENCEDLLRLKADDDVTLYMVKTGKNYTGLDSASFSVHLDGECIGKSNELLQATAMTVAAVYIFNVEFPKKLCVFYEFVHCYFLELPLSKTVSKKVKKLAVRLAF